MCFSRLLGQAGELGHVRDILGRHAEARRSLIDGSVFHTLSDEFICKSCSISACSVIDRQPAVTIPELHSELHDW